MKYILGVIRADRDANGRPTNGQMIVSIPDDYDYETDEIEPAVSDIELYAMIAYMNKQFTAGWHADENGEIVTD